MPKKKTPKRLAQLTPDTLLGNAIGEEQDRGSVLVGATYLEYRLYELLRGQFRTNPEMDWEIAGDALFAPLALLGDLWKKTTIAFLFGLINREHYDLLEKMRNLRNHFAHHPGIVALDSKAMEPILSVITDKRQKVIARAQDAYESGRETVYKLISRGQTYSRERIAFMEICLMANNYLNDRITEVDPAEAESRAQMIAQLKKYGLD